MSRTKSFPEKIYVGMTTDGMYIIPKDDPLNFVLSMGITKTALYIIGGEQPKKCLISTKSAPTPASAPKKAVCAPQGKPEAFSATPGVASKPKSPRNKKEKPMFRCTGCGKDVDNPTTASGGKVQCPHCLVVGTIVGKDD